MCATGRCSVRREPDENYELIPIAWDDGPAWEFGLDVVPSQDGQHYTLMGLLRRGEQSMPMSEPLLLTASGLVFTTETASRLEVHEAFDWIVHLRQHGFVRVPQKDGGLMLERLLALPKQPPLRLPPELQVEKVRVTPRPRLKVHDKSRQGFSSRARLTAHYAFDYDGVKVPAADPRPGIYQKEQRRLLLRDHEVEERAGTRLRQLGFRDPSYFDRLEENQLELVPKKLPQVVAQLLAEGWRVEVEGKLYRRPGQINIGVSSGIDWFELRRILREDLLLGGG